jgi:multicomponent Na+:H+ antiporter subunit E
VEFPLRCRTDLQITALSASITITPGTLVLGTAEAREGTPPTLFVHALFAPDRESVLADLRDMETRLLRAAGAPADVRPEPSGGRAP